MPESTRLEQSKLPPEERAVVRRLREARRRRRFSLAEVAAACELTRSALQHYEDGDSPLPFVAGDIICRKLDLNQQWLALDTGSERPWLDLSAFPVEPLILKDAQRVTFFEACDGPLREYLEGWFAMPASERPGVELDLEATFRGMSRERLESNLAQTVEWLRAEPHAINRPLYLESLRAQIEELENRCGLKIPVDEHTPPEDMSPMQISKRLKQARKRLGNLSQSQAAEKWGVSIRTLQQWEQGARTPRGLAMRQLETILRTAGKSSD